MPFRVGPPNLGVYDDLVASGLAYPANASPEMLNVRVARHTWQTRLGMEQEAAVIPGVSRTRLASSFYPDNGSRIRIAGRGADGAVALCDLLVGTDTAYQPVFDAAAALVNDLAGNPIHTQENFNRLYLTDQSGVMLCYEASTRRANQVLGLDTPASAPSVKKTWYRYVEDWSGNAGVAPFGWTETANGDFDILGTTATEPTTDLAGSIVVRLRVTSGQDSGGCIRKNNSSLDPLGISLQTYQLGFWVSQTNARAINSIQWGQDRLNEESQTIDPPNADTPFILFLDVGGIKDLNYLQFKNLLSVGTTRNTYVSGIVQCGRLTGQYQWRGTYYRPDTDEESSPSSPGPSTPMEFVSGRSYQQTTATALRRSAFLTLPANPTREAGDMKRFYRSGGVPSLTSNVLGQPIYTYIGECLDLDTTTDGAITAGDADFDVTDATGFAEGDWAIIDKGEDFEEYFQIEDITGDTITPYTLLEYDHDTGATVELGILDNVSNEVLGAEVRKLDLDRDPPPLGCGWIVSLPNGRMAVGPFYEDGDFQPLKVAFSNQPQPISGRRRDMEVFPVSPSPYTQRSLTQGFRAIVATDAQGDRIMWMGLFRGALTVLTTRACYQTADFSQAQWSSNSWQKRFDRGCIAPETVQEVNGRLMWVSDGPAVLAWDGVSGGPQDLSHLRVSRTLEDAPLGYLADGDVFTEDAPNAYVEAWFARYHAKGQSAYWRLWMTPTDPLQALLTDVMVLSISPTVVVSSASYTFTAADVGRLMEVPDENPAPGWTPGWYQILSVDEEENTATLDRAPATPNEDIEFVQELGFDGETSTGGSATLEITLTDSVPVGHTVIITAELTGNGVTPTTFGTPTDDAGNVYTLAKQVNLDPTRTAMWAAPVTVQLEAGDKLFLAFNNYRMAAFRASEFSGLQVGSAVDKTCSDSGTSNTNTTEPLPAITNVPQLLICALGTHSENPATGNNTASAGTGWTKMTADTGISVLQPGPGVWYNDDLFVEWRVVEAGGVYTANWTYAPPATPSTYNWGLVAATFPATGPGIVALWDPWNSRRLDYDAVNDAWEPVEYGADWDGDGERDAALGWETADVRYGYGDRRELFAAVMNGEDGDVWEMEVGDLDGEVPVYVLARSARQAVPGENVASVSDLFMRLAREAGGTDRLNVAVTMGGAEYGQLTTVYEVTLEGDGDTEVPVYQTPKQPARGRWFQVTLEGNVRERPAPRELTGELVEVRDGRVSE